MRCGAVCNLVFGMTDVHISVIFSPKEMIFFFLINLSSGMCVIFLK